MQLGSWNPQRSSGGMEGQMRQKITVSETRSIINSCIVAGGTTLRQPGSETPKPKQTTNGTLKLKQCTNDVREADMKPEQTMNDTLRPRQCTNEAQEMEMKLQQATNQTREILSSCVMEEGMTSAVEFLSVECDMIFEPDCDLETEDQRVTVGGEADVPFINHSLIGHTNGFGFHSGGDARLQNNVFGHDNFVIPHDDLGPPVVDYQNDYGLQLASLANDGDPASMPNDPSLPLLYRSPLIGELFQRRGVVVYKRTSRDSPYVKIYHPNLSATPKNGLRNGKLGAASSRKRVQDKSSDSGGEGPGQHPRGQRRDRSSRDPGRGRSPWVYRCAKCRKQFGSKIRLLTHRLVHSRKTGDVYVCPVCESNFTNKASLKIHIQRKVCLKNVQNQFRDKRQRQNQLRGGQQTGKTIAKRGSRGTNAGGGSVAKAGNATPQSCQPSPQSNTHPRLAASPVPRENYGQVESASGQERTNGTTTYKTRKTHTRLKPQSKTRTTDAPDTAQANRMKCKSCKTMLPQRPTNSERKAGPGALHCDKCRATSKHKRSHRERKSYECPECGSQYRKSSALKKHRRLEHDVT